MRGLIVVLSCATLVYSAKGNPLQPELVTLGPVDGPSDHRESKALPLLPVPGATHHQGLGGQVQNQPAGGKPVVGSPPQNGHINEQSVVNPFLHGSQHHPIGSHNQPSGGQVDGQSGVKPVGGSHYRELGGHHQQPGVNPFLQGSHQHRIPDGGGLGRQLEGQQVGSHIRPSGGLIDQRSGVKPVDGSYHQGGYINQQPGVNPFLQGSQEHYTPNGGLGRQLEGQHVGSHIRPSGGQVDQRSGVKPEEDSHHQGLGGHINQQPRVNPFLHGSQEHYIPKGGLGRQLEGQHVGSHIRPSSGTVDQRSGVKPVEDSHHQGLGGHINQQPRVNPFLHGSQEHYIPKGELGRQLEGQHVGSHIRPSGGSIDQRSGVKPEEDSHHQGLGRHINQQLRVNPFLHGSQEHYIPKGGLGRQLQGQHVGSHIRPSSGQVDQRSGVKSVDDSHHQRLDGHVNQQPGVNPFLQGSQKHYNPNGGLGRKLDGHQVGSHIHPSGGLVQQRSGVQPEDSHRYPYDEPMDEQAEVRTIGSSHLHSSVDGKTYKEHSESPSHHQIEILSQDTEVNPDGSYHNVWEAENGIKVQEEGMVNVHNDVPIQSVSGSIAYTDDDGTPILLTYTADENGFHPQGDHLPTPPPIPTSVVRALEYIAAHPYVEEKHIEGHETATVKQEELPIIEVA